MLQGMALLIYHIIKSGTRKFFGSADFSLLNSFVACNLSVDLIQKKQRGKELNRYTVLKSEFYTAVVEEMMSYTDGVDNNDNNTRQNKDHLHGHSPVPISLDYGIRRPQCDIYFMEESVMYKVQRFNKMW